MYFAINLKHFAVNIRIIYRKYAAIVSFFHRMETSLICSFMVDLARQKVLPFSLGQAKPFLPSGEYQF
jgi:hypothetical protein